MSVGLAQPEWNDDWKHAGDKTEPPETKDDRHTCETCWHWERCPCGCAWGWCSKCVDFTRETFAGCEGWEEA